MSISGYSWSECGVDADGASAPVRELTPMTLRVIKHELRTPINHIIGYSEMLIEDLTSCSDAAARSAMHVVLDTGKDMLAVVNAQVKAGSDPESVVSSDVLASLRVAVGTRVDDVFVKELERISLGRPATFSADVQKIIDAMRRLAEFARTGELPAS